MLKHCHLGTLYLVYSLHYVSTETNPVTGFCSLSRGFYTWFIKTKGDCMCNYFIFFFFFLFFLSLPIYSSSGIHKEKAFVFDTMWIVHPEISFKYLIHQHSKCWEEKKNLYFGRVQVILSLRLLSIQYPYLKGSYVVKYVKKYEWK